MQTSKLSDNLVPSIECCRFDLRHWSAKFQLNTKRNLTLKVMRDKMQSLIGKNLSVIFFKGEILIIQQATVIRLYGKFPHKILLSLPVSRL